jgi:excisionase family DNA binding protein
MQTNIETSQPDAPTNVAQNHPFGPRLAGPLLRPEQAAELLAVKPSWVYEAVRTGRPPCLRVGRHIRFTQTMLETWLTDQ